MDLEGQELMNISIEPLNYTPFFLAATGLLFTLRPNPLTSLEDEHKLQIRNRYRISTVHYKLLRISGYIQIPKQDSP